MKGQFRMDNLERAKKIEKILGLRGNDTEFEYPNVSDTIAELIHFCNTNGIDFDHEMKMAYSYYVSEKDTKNG